MLRIGWLQRREEEGIEEVDCPTHNLHPHFKIHPEMDTGLPPPPSQQQQQQVHIQQHPPLQPPRRMASSSYSKPPPSSSSPSSAGPLLLALLTQSLSVLRLIEATRAQAEATEEVGCLLVVRISGAGKREGGVNDPLSASFPPSSSHPPSLPLFLFASFRPFAGSTA